MEFDFLAASMISEFLGPQLSRVDWFDSQTSRVRSEQTDFDVDSDLSISPLACLSIFLFCSLGCSQPKADNFFQESSRLVNHAYVIPPSVSYDKLRRCRVLPGLSSESEPLASDGVYS